MNLIKTFNYKSTLPFIISAILFILPAVSLYALHNNNNSTNMKIIILGCPGAGKGTQAQFLSKHYNIPIISTGDMLRAAAKSKSKFGLHVKQIMDSGELVPDNVIIDLVKDRISKSDCKNGYLLDGFPRTVEQAKELAASKINIDYVIEIYVPDKEIVERITYRRVHPASGRVYHLKHNPPKKCCIDDVTGEPLVQRDDDKEQTVLKRLQVYHEKTEPIIKYYNDLAAKKSANAPHYVRIDGTGAIEQVQQNILKACHRQKPEK